jgi:hypothetical protein
MIRTIDEKGEDSWLQRTLAEGQSPGRPDATSDLPARAFSAMAQVAWDPHDVWLRRVERPCRRRANGEPSPD